jgi:hypothetical protein
MKYFDFQKTSTKINVRRATTKYLRSDVPEDPVVAKGDALPETFWPMKYLPIIATDQSTEDGLVAVKGTIMALSGQMEYFHSEAIRHPIPDDTGVDGVSTIHLGTDYSGGSSVNTISAHNAYWAYPDDHIGVVVPCNGYNNTTYTYTQYDVDHGSIMMDGNTVTAITDDITIAANRPLGLSMTHLMKDIRGEKLNYYSAANKAYSLYTDGYVMVPYVNWPKVADNYSLANTTFVAADGGSYYDTIKSIFPFAYSNDDTSTYARNGDFIVSDTYGRFAVDPDLASRTKDVVGKLVGVDFKFPKGLMPYVDNKIGSGLMGTNTGGIPEVLYLVAGTLMESIDTTPTIQEVQNAVKAGLFGMARIDFNV